MNNSFDVETRGSRYQLFAVAALALGAAGLPPRVAAAKDSAGSAEPASKAFVLIFRQGAKPLTEGELKRRADEVRAWAVQQNAAGRKLEPRLLGPEGHSIDAGGKSAPLPAASAGSLGALLFLVARDLADAVDAAKTHPALRHGASVEIRPWAPPAAPLPPAPPPPPARR